MSKTSDAKRKYKESGGVPLGKLIEDGYIDEIEAFGTELEKYAKKQEMARQAQKRLTNSLDSHK